MFLHASLEPSQSGLPKVELIHSIILSLLLLFLLPPATHSFKPPFPPSVLLSDKQAALTRSWSHVQPRSNCLSHAASLRHRSHRNPNVVVYRRWTLLKDRAGNKEMSDTFFFLSLPDPLPFESVTIINY